MRLKFRKIPYASAPLIIIVFAIFYSNSSSSTDLQIGANYNYSDYEARTCPEIEHNTAFIADYAAQRSKVRSQLASMRNSGLKTLRSFAGWGNNFEAASDGSFTGSLIVPPAKSLPLKFVDGVVLFLQDASEQGFRVTLSLSGAGAYDSVCGNDIQGLVIPTFNNAIDQIKSALATAGLNSVTIEIGNEIAPSSYSTQCDIDAKLAVIKAVWARYTSNYGRHNVTFSSILDDSADFSIAGNRLRNLVQALSETGAGYPDIFDVHVYAESQTETINMLRGVYQVYSDFGFLSNQSQPKLTTVGEAFYNDDDTAYGIAGYLRNYDGYLGGYIGLIGLNEWPLRKPAVCAHAANVAPPYVADRYQRVLSDNVFHDGFDSARN